jgi:hypothetical protein
MLPFAHGAFLDGKSPGRTSQKERYQSEAFEKKVKTMTKSQY